MRNEEKVMKKELLVLLASVLTFYTGKTVSAKETYQLLGVNPAGEYYVEQESLEKALQKEKGGLLEQVKTKAVLKDQNFIRLLGETYEKKLEDNDRPGSCELIVSLNLENHTYKVDQVALLSKKGKVIEKKQLMDLIFF